MTALNAVDVGRLPVQFQAAAAELLAQRDDLLVFAEAVAEYAEYHDDEESYENLRGILSRLEGRARAAIAKARGK